MFASKDASRCWVNRIPDARVPLHLLDGDTAGPCVFLSVETPANIKASVRRVPTFPCPRPPPSQSKFDWIPAQMSTDSRSLSTDIAHDLLWHRGLSSNHHPRPYCSPRPPKKLPAPKRRHSAKTGTTTIMASVPMCDECAVTALLAILGRHALT